MKNILVDIYLAYNLGDDLFLDVLAKRYPNATITVFHPGNNYNRFFKSYNNVSKIPYTFKNKLFRRLKIHDKLTDYSTIAQEYDALLFLGGSIFREEAFAKKVYKYRLQIINSFKKENKKVFFLGCNFGPFKNESFVNQYKKLFKAADDVCFRDKYSYNLFKDIEQVRYAPDILWSYPIPKNPITEKSIGYSIINPMHKEGLAKYYKDYIHLNTQSILKNIELGYTIKLLSYCEMEGDLKIINEILKDIPQKLHNEIEVLKYKGNIDYFIDRFSSIDVLFAARFHANILGLLCNINVVPIIYSVKTSNLLNDLNFEGEIISFNELDKLQTLNIANIKNTYSLNKEAALDHFTRLDKIAL